MTPAPGFYPPLAPTPCVNLTRAHPKTYTGQKEVDVAPAAGTTYSGVSALDPGEMPMETILSLLRWLAESERTSLCHYPRPVSQTVLGTEFPHDLVLQTWRCSQGDGGRFVDYPIQRVQP